MLDDLLSWLEAREGLLSAIAAITAIFGALVYPVVLLVRKARPKAEHGFASPAAAPTSRLPPTAASAKTSIAVLPVQTIGEGSQASVLAGGLSGEIGDALTRIGGVRVISRLPSQFSEPANVDFHEISEQFKADYILAMSLGTPSDRVRVKAVLHRVPEGFVAWSQTFEQPLNELFSVQQAIMEAVANTLGGELFRSEYLRVREQPVENLDAWALTQHSANLVISGENAPNWDQAIALARRAIDIDPEFGPAHARLSALLSERVTFFLTPTPDQDVAEALQAADRGARLAPYDPYVLMNCGQGWALCGRVDRGRQAFDQAVRQLPYDSLAWLFFCFARVFSGNEEALREVLEICDRMYAQSARNPLYPAFGLLRLTSRFRLGERQQIVDEHADFCLQQPRESVGLWPIVVAALGELGEAQRAQQIFGAIRQEGFCPRPEAIGPTYLRLAGDDPVIADKFTNGFIRAGIIPSQPQ